jgi:hypothetical protein
MVVRRAERQRCDTSPESGMFDAAEAGMNTSLRLLLVLTAVGALSVAYPAKANLITNGGFERETSPAGRRVSAERRLPQ